MIECNDVCTGPAFWRSIEGVGDVSLVGCVGSPIIGTQPCRALAALSSSTALHIDALLAMWSTRSHQSNERLVVESH